MRGQQHLGGRGQGDTISSGRDVDTIALRPAAGPRPLRGSAAHPARRPRRTPDRPARARAPTTHTPPPPPPPPHNQQQRPLPAEARRRQGRGHPDPRQTRQRIQAQVRTSPPATRATSRLTPTCPRCSKHDRRHPSPAALRWYRTATTPCCSRPRRLGDGLRLGTRWYRMHGGQLHRLTSMARPKPDAAVPGETSYDQSHRLTLDSRART